MAATGESPQAREPRHEISAASSSDASDSPTSPTHPRLSCLSCTTRHALTLNQIERVAVRTSQRRTADGAALFAVDVFVRQCQSGIPDVRRSVEFVDEHRDSSRGIIEHLESGDTISSATDVKAPDDEKRRHESSLTHYQMEYRYSAFRGLRAQLRVAVRKNKNLVHAKWCSYCAAIEWLSRFEPFPSRHPVVRLLSRCVRREEAEQTVLERFFQRRRKLERFLNAVLMSAKDASYRFQSAQSECYARVSGVVVDFLAQPHLSVSTGYGW